ncbi:MAG: vitamin K epoxide reductase family protein [Minisyncoccia bacterium]
MTALNILYVCGVIGVLDTLYLVYHKMRGTEVACIFFPKEWCYKVQHSPQSKTLGIPNSLAGLVMYALILIFTYYFSLGQASFLWVKYIVTFGFLFSMYFTYVQAFVLRAFCTWCVVSALNFIVMAYVVWFM